MTNEEKVRYWIELVDRDINTAEYNVNGGHHLHGVYLCHQAVEKIFKAYFAKTTDETPPYTHDLVGLAQKTGIWEEMSEEQKYFVGVLNPFNIEARYPEYKSKLDKSLTDEIAKKILTQAKEMIEWIKSKI